MKPGDILVGHVYAGGESIIGQRTPTRYVWAIIGDVVHLGRDNTIPLNAMAVWAAADVTEAMR